MFLPTTQSDLQARGWNACDVILVSGDTYIDSAFSGVAVVGRLLEAAGFRVGIIAQPTTDSDVDILRLGTPTLFWGVSAGCVDSMVANYTALNKKRRQDDFTPGGENNRRPDRASIVYANLIRRYAGSAAPIVLGGIEASLRRVSHYDFWQEKIRKSILPDAKADFLLYGMADKAICTLAQTLQEGGDPRMLNGICYLAQEPPEDAIQLPTHNQVLADPQQFIEMFHTFYRNCDPGSAKPLAQQQDTRWLVQTPPAPYLTTEELDQLHELPFENAVHPYYATQGEVRALDTIQASITTHRGCFGQCNFCAIAVHQGRTIRSRSHASILREATRLASSRHFKGTISDVGGPTANMYAMGCNNMDRSAPCPARRCLADGVCHELRASHAAQRNLLRDLRRIPGVKHIFVSSGIRHDLIMSDSDQGVPYTEDLCAHHVSGQLRLAPEHTEPSVLACMGKPDTDPLLAFKRQFDHANQKSGKKQFLSYYFIAAHPGCTRNDMDRMKRVAASKLGISPSHVQVFTPTPSTYSTLMYATGLNPFTGAPVHVERKLSDKRNQLEAAVGIQESHHTPPQYGKHSRKKPGQRRPHRRR
jgi:uncharacterized radical SAM protein YgiQ